MNCVDNLIVVLTHDLIIIKKSYNRTKNLRFVKATLGNCFKNISGAIEVLEDKLDVVYLFTVNLKETFL